VLKCLVAGTSPPEGERLVGFRQIGVDRDGTLEARHGLLYPAPGQQRIAEPVPRLSKARVKRKRTPVAFLACLQPLCPIQGIGTVDVRLGKVRCQLDSAVGARQTGFECALLVLDRREIAVRARVVRIEREGAAVTFRCIRPPPRRTQGVTQVQMGGREVRQNGDRPLDQLDCTLMSSTLVRNDSEKVHSVDMIRSFLQHLAIEGLGSISPPGLVMREGGLKVPENVRLSPDGLFVVW